MVHGRSPKAPLGRLPFLRAVAPFLLVSAAACDNGVPTGSAPLRTATISISASASEPRCDGSFTGSGQVTAAYAGLAANVASYKVVLGAKDKDNVTLSAPTPDTISISGPSSSPQSYSIVSGNLDDVCKAGSYVVASDTTSSASPPQLSHESSPAVGIAAIGFRTTKALDVSGNENFSVTFQLSCCPGAAGPFIVQLSNKVNIGTLAAPGRLNCPGPKNFTI